MPFPNWSSGDVSANGIRLHWTRTGGRLPAVVMAHGFTDDGLCWAPVAELLESDWDVVMVDARGHGRSDAPATGYDARTAAEDLLGACDALGLRRPVLVGHSMGAVSALVAAGTRSDALGGIFLEDPPGLWETGLPLLTREFSDKYRAKILERATQTPAQIEAECRTDNPLWSDAEVARWVEAQQRVSLAAAGPIGGEEPAGVAWEAVLPAVTCPVQVVAADLAVDGLLTNDAVELLRRAAPQVQVVRFAGAGHSVRREAFSGYMDVLRRFLGVAYETA